MAEENNMKIAELIKKLSEAPPDEEVMLYDGESATLDEEFHVTLVGVGTRSHEQADGSTATWPVIAPVSDRLAVVLDTYSFEDLDYAIPIKD